ncbi:MAG: hypothetical protein RBQ99_07915 [Trichlorobacter sp.]|nr:hypothetical protein [Trichlorobacter sp.]
MGHTVEFDFISEEGLRCVGLALTHGHRCGYVGVPRGHVLYGIEYSATLPDAVSFVTEEIMENADLSHRGSIPVFYAALTGEMNRLDVVVDVHGSLTYSDGGEGTLYPVPDNALWWFGFGCAHAGDGKDFSIMDEKTKEMYSSGFRYYSEGLIRSKEYVMQHCKLLARQLWYINSMVWQSALPEGKEK